MIFVEVSEVLKIQEIDSGIGVVLRNEKKMPSNVLKTRLELLFANIFPEMFNDKFQKGNANQFCRFIMIRFSRNFHFPKSIRVFDVMASGVSDMFSHYF